MLRNILLLLFIWLSIAAPTSLVSIRGHYQLQSLPKSLTGSWRVWTLSTEGSLSPIENHIDDEGGWVDPTSYSDLFLPLDLPIPTVRPALGIAVANGIARYIMPSVLVSITTPADRKEWRNRGLCSLPRAGAWIDLFAPNAPKLSSLRMSLFAQSKLQADSASDSVSDSDSDSGSFSNSDDGEWRELCSGVTAVCVQTLYEAFCLSLSDPGSELNAKLKEGFHFVDAALATGLTAGTLEGTGEGGKGELQGTDVRLKSYLTDLDDPLRLCKATTDDPTFLDGEPVGELAIDISGVMAGGESEFLPEAYKNLYVWKVKEVEREMF